MKKNILLSIILILILILIISIIFFLYNNKKFTPSSIPKKIWIFWDKPIEKSNSFSVKLCHDIIKRKCKDYEINIVNLENYKNYINDRRVINIIENKDLGLSHISDLLRLCLIEKYGGIYLDASIILLRSLDWIYNFGDEYEFIMYKNTNHTTNDEKPVLESWFIAAKPNCTFIRLAKEKTIEIFSNYEFLEEELEKLRTERYVDYQNFSDHGSYHIVYYIFIYILYNYNITNGLFLTCSPEKLICSFIKYYGEENKEHTNLFIKPISDKEYEIIEQNNMVKLIKNNRSEIDNMRTIVEGSFIDRILKK